MAVAADWNAGEFRPTPGGPVMLAMERNEAASASVATAYSLATIFKRPLLVIHARSAAEASAFLNPCATTLEEFGIKTSEGVPVRCMVKDGSPADAMADAIKQYHPSILVVGVKRTSETPGPHGTAFALLARSRVPVMCVPPEAAADGLGREVSIPLEAV
jgi:nucleotide-binding universal stress UspA family protein